MKESLIVISLILMACCSCQSNIKDCGLYEDVANWKDKIIQLPSDSSIVGKGDISELNTPSTDYFIFRYISPNGCTSCKLHLHLYAEILRELSDSSGVEVGFLCVVHTKDVDNIKHVLKRDNSDNLSVWVDETDTINKINQFLEDERFQTFLLDKENRVLAIGDPAVNPRVMQLFVDVLRSDSIRARGRHHLREQVVAQ